MGVNLLLCLIDELNFIAGAYLQGKIVSVGFRISAVSGIHRGSWNSSPVDKGDPCNPSAVQPSLSQGRAHPHLPETRHIDQGLNWSYSCSEGRNGALPKQERVLHRCASDWLKSVSYVTHPEGKGT